MYVGQCRGTVCSSQCLTWDKFHMSQPHTSYNNNKRFDQKTGIGLVLWTWTKRWDEQWKDKQRQVRERENALICECKRWLLSRCSCDGQIRDSGVKAAPKSRSIIHRDRSSHCRKLWKQNILNGLSHPIHKRQLTVTHTPTHSNDHTDAISFQKGKSRIKNCDIYKWSILCSATGVIQTYHTVLWE